MLKHFVFSSTVRTLLADCLLSFVRASHHHLLRRPSSEIQIADQNVNTSWGVEAEEVHREGECQERGVKLSKKRTLWDSIVEKDFRGPAPDSVFGGLESSLLLLLPWSSLLPPLNALED